MGSDEGLHWTEHLDSYEVYYGRRSVARVIPHRDYDGLNGSGPRWWAIYLHGGTHRVPLKFDTPEEAVEVVGDTLGDELVQGVTRKAPPDEQVGLT